MFSSYSDGDHNNVGAKNFNNAVFQTKKVERTSIASFPDGECTPMEYDDNSGFYWG